MISIDISEYGDPLSARVIRVPFSLYLKPSQQRRILGEDQVKSLPAVFLIPVQGMDSPQGIGIMHDVRRVCELARHSTARIPRQARATERLLRLYLQSPLKWFHDWFYSKAAEPPEKWLAAYGDLPPDALPLCARHVLEHPNDLLLKPANLERVTRVLMALGWHPRHIAGLIRRKFVEDHGWGGVWRGYDPGLRAEFYVRVFAGLFATGVDDLVAFNCRSAQEEKIFCATPCPFNLEPYKESLLNRRKYERLARRPFNRLFLPTEHL